MYGFYLIGYLHVVEILREVVSRPDREVSLRFGANAHVRAGISNAEFWDRFWVFKGSQHSRRFHRAVPLSRWIVSKVFKTANGSSWRWDCGRTDLQTIGSYTRSCRCMIDSSIPNNKDRASEFWDWIRRHSGCSVYV